MTTGTLSFGAHVQGLHRKLGANKTHLVTFALLLLFASGTACAALWIRQPLFSNFGFMACLFFAGYLLRQVLHGEVLQLTPPERLIYSGYWGMVVLMLLSSFTFWLPRLDSLLALAGASAFLLPLSIDAAWQAFGQLATPNAQAWFYSPDITLETPAASLNSQPIRFMVHSPERLHPLSLSFQAPLDMALGLVFYRAVQAQKDAGAESIQLTDEAGQGYGWFFYTRTITGGRGFLNPDAGLADNGLRKDSLIIVQRVADQDLFPDLPRASVQSA